MDEQFLDLLFVWFSFAALIRHNKSGIVAFRLANGYAALRDALGSESVRFQRYINLGDHLNAQYMC